MNRFFIWMALLFTVNLQASLGPTALAGLNAHKDDSQLTSWVKNVYIAGGTLSTNDVIIARGLIEAINRSTFRDKIVHLLPMLGQNVAACRVALINRLGISATATNTNFVDADFSPSTGLKGNGSNKIFTLAFAPGQLGSGSNGGFGYWENSIDFTGTSVEPVGCYNSGGTNRFVLDLRSNVRSFRWGNAGNGAGDSTAATNGDYYGQRSSATSRELFKDGASLATNTTSDSASGASDRGIRLMGADENGTITYWKGRCAVAYFTDGTLTSTEVADLHTLLNTYLITPTGR